MNSSHWILICSDKIEAYRHYLRFEITGDCAIYRREPPQTIIAENHFKH